MDEQKLELVGRTQGSKQIEDRFVEQQKNLQDLLSELYRNRTFTMTGFTKAKNESSTWSSPEMYTHLRGYKFFFEIKANGVGAGWGGAVYVDLCSTPGDFDRELKWPANVKIKLEVISQHGGNDLVAQKGVSWHTCGESTYIGNNYYPRCSGCPGYYHLMSHHELRDYLLNDTLHFRVSTSVL